MRAGTLKPYPEQDSGILGHLRANFHLPLFKTARIATFAPRFLEQSGPTPVWGYQLPVVGCHLPVNQQLKTSNQ